MWMQISKYYILQKKEKFFIYSDIGDEIPKSPGLKNLPHVSPAWWWEIKPGPAVTRGTLLCLVPFTSQLKQPPTLLPVLWLGLGTIPSIRIWTYTFGFVAFPWAALTLSLLSDQTTEKKFLGLFGCGGSMALYWIICHWSRLKQNCTSAPVCWMTLSHHFWKVSEWSNVMS